MKQSVPAVIISDEGIRYIEGGQMWMYRNNLVSAPDVPDGSIVQIRTQDGRYLAAGMYSSVSHIVVRILSRNEAEQIDEAFFVRQIRRAWEYRKTVEPDNLTNCRVIFAEADGLPGLICDRYNQILVTQISCQGLEVRREMLYRILLQVLREDGQDVQAVYERNDIRQREKEGLPLYQGFFAETELSPQTVISENGLLLNVDIENGQKTGYFLDQKSNRLLIRHLAHGKKVLDCFTHTGGFALNAALGNASQVTAVDVSANALQQAQKNADLNGLANVTFVQADVFEYLDTVQEAQFDLIILDPPAFTKSRRTVMKAYNGYKRINRQAMRVLRNGGYLATCSCSRYMETELFERMLKEAASEEKVILRQVSVTQQNADHPIVWQMSESSYLKFFIFQIESAGK